MKNKLFLLVTGISIIMFAACNNAEKIRTAPAAQGASSGNKIISSQTMTPGQMHNQILKAYLDQYGIVEDNEVTMAEMETLCDRMAQIAEDQGFLTHITAAELGDNLFNGYVSSGAFVNGILRPTDELITMANNAVPNPDVRNAFNQVHDMAHQGDPDFIQNATQLLDNLSGLNQDDQQAVNAFKSILQSSYDFWTDPNTPKPSYAQVSLSDIAWFQNIAMADAAGFSKAYYDNLGGGRSPAETAGTTGADAASGAASGKP